MPSLKTYFDKAAHKSKQRGMYQARLGDGQGNVYVEENGTRKAGYVWARISLPSGASAQVIECRKLTPVNNLMVWVQKNERDRWEVEKSDLDFATAYYEGNPPADVGQHAIQHGRLMNDPIVLDALQYRPLLTEVERPAGLTVRLQPATYIHNGSRVWYPGGSLDLSAAVPGTPSLQRIAITGVNPITNIASYLTGDTVTETIYPYYVPFNGSDAVVILNGTSGFIPSGAVRLYSQQTRINIPDIFADMRDWLTTGHDYDLNADDITDGTLALDFGGTGIDGTGLNGLFKVASGVTTELKYNFAATVAPTVNDDVGDGFIVGSRWLDTTNDREYVCLNNASGAAIWLLSTLVNSLAGDTLLMAALRTITNSNDSGTQGEVCFDANYAYFCVADDTWKRAALSTW